MNIWLNINGQIQIGWPEKSDNISISRYLKSEKNKIRLLKDKSIHLETIGDKIKSSQKKIIKFLMDNNIIDNTWKIEGKNIKEYLGREFTSFTDPYAPKNVSDINKLDTISPNIKNIVLYHGTSEYDWDNIKKSGALYPLFKGSNKQYGYESRFKHEHNKDFIYLATTIDKAWDYAKARARSINQTKDKDWKYTQGSGTENWMIRPVLLRVEIPDVSNLRADDDIANEKMRNIARNLWDKKSSDEKQEIMQQLSRQKGWEITDPSVGQMIWRDTDEAFPVILNKLNPKIFNTWLASMLRQDQVAYKGIIPIKFIKEIPIFPKR